MRSIVLGLLITCVPVCFASAQYSPEKKTHVQAQTAQQIQAEKKKQQPQLQSNKPKVQVQNKKGKDGQVVKKTVRTVKRDGTIIEEHHVYHHYDQPEPKRVVIRRVPKPHAKRVVVRRHHSAPPVRVVRHYHEEPRVVYAPRPMVMPAPVQMSIGYRFG